jgi:hypothetical protein
MKEKDENGNLSARQENRKENRNLEGYPLYSTGEDFYSKFEEDKDIDPENISIAEESPENEEISPDTTIDSKKEKAQDNLDVPGAELDDAQEGVGSEDEENNYYSIGGDGHDDLEEDKGE